MNSYPDDIQQLIDHFLQEFKGRVLISTREAAQVLDRTEGSLCVDRCKGIGPEYIKLRRAVRYNLYSLADHLTANRVMTGRVR